MEPRKYSIQELLQLRGSIHRAAPNTLQTKDEFVDLAKNQDTAVMSSTHDQRMKKATGNASSSTESDEIVFRGKNQLRNQWKFRGRTESEITTNEPASAPTGLVAQKSEGFQKFFKAVVSPTHVRVTAGGRIVPNTRGSVSPTAKWDKEQSTVGMQNSTDMSKEAKPNSSSGIGGQMTHPIVFQQLPGHVGYFQHMGLPMPLYPIHQGIPMGYSMLSPHPASSAKEQATHVRTHQDTEDEEKAFKTQDGAGDKKPRPAPIKIPSHSHLDGNRPFYHNGHVVYPHVHGPGQVHTPIMLPNPYFPPGMLGSPAFAHPYAGAAGPGAQLSPATPIFGPGPINPAHFAGASTGSVGNQPLQLQLPPTPMQAAPHVTSIRPSDITKRQLENLQLSLKHYRDQLQYNKHQIDEEEVMGFIAKLEQEVRQFEHNYVMQTNFESIYYPKTAPSPVDSTHQDPALKTPSGASTVRTRREVNASQNSLISANDSANDYGHGLSSRQSSERIGSRCRNPRGIGMNSNKGLKSALDVDPTLEALIQSKAQELGISEPSKAAGAHGNVSTTSASNLGMQSSRTTQPEGQHRVAQPGSSSAYELGSWQVPSVMPSQPQGAWQNAHAFNMYAAHGIAPGHVQSSAGSQPYLVGMLPQGMQPHNARATDYVYSRELTEEEKQARQNYWGQVPSGGMGLPKFDGKDFYHPSPVKATRTEGASQSAFQHGMIGEAAANYQVPQNDPFRHNRETQGARSQETTSHRVSKAIPIVAPDDAGQADASKMSKMIKSMKVSSAAKSSEGPSAETNQNSSDRRALERFSTKSGHELWQTMLKRGSTSGTVLPSTVSSATATGYLPQSQYQGYAAASLGPAISNTYNSSSRVASEVGNKAVEHDAQAHEKTGENRPPNETRSEDYDPVKDVQERMLRDAERRGIIGSDW
ncbi:hypothetical protein F5Y06DRAFT_283981 [Hypoxylon sp. FL0890]|nr:hypothetical protein F5Y06DRAFT_283981 [Hypoxylon sp. FL0890]